MSEDLEVSQWISEILGSPLPEGDLKDVLKNGFILCQLINKILSNTPSAIKEPSKSNLGFFQMENIEYFILKARECGVPNSENFQTIDLYEGKNIKQVLTCIYSLSRNLYKKGRTDIRVIGPKLVEKVPITFSKEQLQDAERAVSGQYGYIKSSKQ